MDSFETNLSKALSMCDGSFVHLTEYSKMYTFTTENISGYLKYFDLKDKSLLTVGSSGDQILGAYYHGARDITLFDKNNNCKYFIWLKIAAILSFDYETFKNFFFEHSFSAYDNDKMFDMELFNKLKPTLKTLNE